MQMSNLRETFNLRGRAFFCNMPQWTCFLLGIFTVVQVWLGSGVWPIIFLLLSSCLPALD